LTKEAYIIAREAIKQAARHEGKLYPKDQESHYLALAVLAALEKSGYVIQKQAAA
jgi:predicted flavoprotein YhiN